MGRTFIVKGERFEMQIGVLEKTAREIYKFQRENYIKKEEVKIYMHPVVKTMLKGEILEGGIDLIEMMGSEIITGYEKEIVISAPNYIFIEPIKIKVI